MVTARESRFAHDAASGFSADPGPHRRRAEPKRMAERLGLKEQQIQRDEATDYASASLTRVCEVARSIRMNVKAEASVA